MIGRVIGKNAGEIVFRYGYNEDVKIGEILVAEDSRTHDLFFLRVIDIQYGYEGAESWGLRAAGEMMAMDEAGHKYEFVEKNRRLYKLASCKPLGYLEGGVFKKPKTIPSHFSAVRRANKEDYKFLEEQSLVVGRLRSGDKIIGVEVGIREELIPHHIGIFATTGMGKSNLMRVIAASAMKSGKYGILIIDPHGEYYEGGDGKGLKHHPMAEERLVVYTPYPAKGTNTLSISIEEVSIADMEEIFNFSDAQRDALYALYGRYGKKWLEELVERDIDELAMEFDNRIHEATFSVLKRRAERIDSSDLIHHDNSISTTDAIINHLQSGKIVLVETSGMYEYEELLISVLLARKILNRNKNMFRDKDRFRKAPPVMITIEEAQRVINEGIFAQIAREGRKFKVGLCAITQQPRLIKPEILSQFNTLFIMGLSDENDRNILKSSSKQDISKMDIEIQSLEKGEAIITYPGAPFAIPAKIFLYDEFIKNIEANGIKKGEIDESFF